MTTQQSRERWPDFLLIGAPKAGTTALHKVLSNHPGIYTGPSKEPRYFSYPGEKPHYSCPGGEANADKITFRTKDYLDLFGDCPDHSRAGEATTAYLHDPEAPANAFKEIPWARLVAILRHPVDRAYSQWLHLLQEGFETVDDFESAWNLERDRKEKGWRSAWLYRERGFYASQLERWLSYYPREQLLVVFYEDWLNNPLDTLNLVCKHLSVANPDCPKLTRENVSSRQPRWQWLHHHMVGDNTLRKWAQHRLPLWARDAITRSIGKMNLKPGPRIDASLRARLAVTYHDDIDRLEALTGHHLGHWR